MEIERESTYARDNGDKKILIKKLYSNWYLVVDIVLYFVFIRRQTLYRAKHDKNTRKNYRNNVFNIISLYSFPEMYCKVILFIHHIITWHDAPSLLQLFTGIHWNIHKVLQWVHEVELIALTTVNVTCYSF